ncbi:MAG: efflux RND transporter periplasmic adaptor subunit [Sphingomonadales bacterium]
MDKKIEHSKYRWLKPAAMGGGILVAGIVMMSVFSPSGGRTLKVDNQRIVISSVTTGTFDDFIPVRGRVTPLKTIFLDAVEGGRVENIYAEDGAFVEAGQLLVELSNTSLLLDVIGREALVTEQLNNLRNLELALEQNRLSHKSNLVEINYQIIRLGRRVERLRPLVARGHAPKSQLEDAEDEYTYFINRRTVTLESQATDERLQKAQMIQLRAAGEQLERNLEVARGNLDSMNVRAPMAGKLTAFDIEIGQSLSRGERLGQLDDPENFKLSANIDEFYLGRVDIEQLAEVNLNGSAYTLRISKVYPQVNNGQFEVDMVFETETPPNIRRGQTLQTRLQLGDPSKALLIPNGAFYQDTGGNWIFVVSSDGGQAIRRNVRLGRRNMRFIEVLEGLEPGEKVITSPYTNYIDMDRLELGS